MSDKRRGLGRGLGALIPTAPPSTHPDSAPAATPDATPDPDATVTDVSRTKPAPNGQKGLKGTSSVTGDPVSRWIVGSGESSDSTNPSEDDRPAPPPGAWFAELPLSAITPNPKQPRQIFEEEALAELVHSITEVGLLQPVVVRPLGADRYELVMGERRWRAHRVAGLDVIPAIIRETTDDDLLRDALLENLHRSQLNALEEAAAYQQLLDDFGCTHDELASRIGRSRPQISNTLRLLKLPPAVQRKVAAGVLSAGHARALLALDNPADMDRLAQRIVAEGLSVRSVEELVSLGEVGRDTSAKTRAARDADPVLGVVADRLESKFETRVTVKANAKGRGKVTIEFGSLDDLQRIVTVVDPQP